MAAVGIVAAQRGEGDWARASGKLFDLEHFVQWIDARARPVDGDHANEGLHPAMRLESSGPQTLTSVTGRRCARV